MPIIDQTVADGPTIHNDGSRRGTIDFTFDDGRVVRRTVRAPDATAWANLLIDLPSKVEAQMAQRDAESAAQTDDEVNDAPIGESSREQIAYAYLKKAYSLDDPYEAYLKFDKFNNYRISKGWNLNQVVAGLASVGMTQEEWDLMRDAYQYLGQATRVATMVDYVPILATWKARESL